MLSGISGCIILLVSITRGTLVGWLTYGSSFYKKFSEGGTWILTSEKRGGGTYAPAGRFGRPVAPINPVAIAVANLMRCRLYQCPVPASGPPVMSHVPSQGC